MLCTCYVRSFRQGTTQDTKQRQKQKLEFVEDNFYLTKNYIAPRVKKMAAKYVPAQSCQHPPHNLRYT
jgi:hypothetical protein